jgi:hypothetical protein
VVGQGSLQAAVGSSLVERQQGEGTVVGNGAAAA